ncbi:hypothetical protein ACN9MH_05060 [Paenibacillus silvae]|uniref:hypothetical protein n=1 Tax=Paenibacillus TaxID=44249 RepID=UPI001C106387|nr:MULTISPECIES: hypothetical protein [Paenibacillus]MBU5353357.1 hypothetical protein [Paenibacillus barcinonensis]MDM5279682.1 hypothetical protein [Paenibacillus silvae]
MNREFLYTRPYTPGEIDDTPVDLDSWFLDDSREKMEEKLRGSSLSDVLIELIDIFQENEPNYQVLLGLFGDKIIKETREGKVLYGLEEIQRPDMNKIEIEIEDQTLHIEKMNIFVSALSLLTVKDKIIGLYCHESIEDREDSLSILIRDKYIVLYAVK